ncbi:DNA LIGASE 6 [Artemisia annua]|uniref:DNA LIGASE 6 n=1 Tax=Artemisia annua TaxID=35608 RepID=A0A2U1LIR3_ARTAN|nr:DNA LIGASE 6 [Artemisia annua]
MRTVLPALAHEIVRNSNHGRVMESQKEMLQGLSAAVIEAYNMLPNLDLPILSVMTKGVEFSCATLLMVPGIPIKPMLAKFRNAISIINGVCKSDTMTFIIDAEVVAVDRKSGPKLLSFQELSSRDREGKNSVIRVDVCLFAFGVMFANGQKSQTDVKTEFDRFEFASSSDVKEVVSEAVNKPRNITCKVLTHLVTDYVS